MKCNFCNKIFKNKGNLKEHLKACTYIFKNKKKILKLYKKGLSIRQIIELGYRRYAIIYCIKGKSRNKKEATKNNSFLRTGHWKCEKCNKKEFTNLQAYLGHKSHCGKEYDIRGNWGTWSKGKTKKNNKTIAKIGKENSIRLKKLGKQNPWLNWRKKNKVKDLKAREKQSETMKFQYKNGTRKLGGGFVKWFTIKSTCGKRTRIQGTWELDFCKWMNKNKLNWKKNNKRFEYFHLKGVSHYLPDFWIDDFKCYVEVKGWWDKISILKKQQFKEKIAYIEGKQIKKIRENNFCIEDFKKLIVL